MKTGQRIETPMIRRRIPLLMVVMASCMVGILIGVYTDVVAVASTIKRLAGNQVMTIYYQTSSLPDRHPLIRRNLSSPIDTTMYVPRDVSNAQLDAVAETLPYISRTAILALFTTLKNDPERDQIHKNVLHNWASLRPHVIPVLFDTDTDPSLTGLARQLGWHVLPMANRSTFDVPYLKAMFDTAKKHVNATFYGYSNGDILYDSGIVNTLSACERTLSQLQQTLNSRPTLQRSQ